MNDNEMQGKDENITKQCRQDFLNEVKFKLRKLVLSQIVFNSLSNNIKECLTERGQEYFQLKLQFICVQTNIKLKEVVTKASSNKDVNQKEQHISIQFQQSQCSLIKIMCYDRQSTQQQILVNIYLKPLDNKINNNNLSSSFQHIGCVYLNLKEIKKQLNERIKYSAIHKTQVQPYFKRINLLCQKEKQQTLHLQQQKDIQNFKHQYQKNQKQQFKYSQFQYQFTPKYIQTTKNNSFLQIRIFHSLNISQVMQLFRLKKSELLKTMLKRSNLRIYTRVVNQNIFISSQNIHNQYHLYQNQFNLQSTRSQFALKTFQIFNTQTQNKHIQNYQQTNLNKRHSHKKTFQQKIYELLQQVKSTKKSFEIQNYQNVKNSEQIKIKNIYCMISPRSNQQQLMSNRNKQKYQEVYESFQTNVVNSIMPVTSLPSIRHSKSEQYLNPNRNQVITSKQRYQNLYRIQKRLESHQKIAAISSRFLHKMYSDQNPQ